MEKKSIVLVLIGCRNIKKMTNSQLIIRFIQGLIKVRLESKEVKFIEDTRGEFIQLDKIECFKLPSMRF